MAQSRLDNLEQLAKQQYKDKAYASLLETAQTMLNLSQAGDSLYAQGLTLSAKAYDKLNEPLLAEQCWERLVKLSRQNLKAEVADSNFANLLTEVGKFYFSRGLYGQAETILQEAQRYWLPHRQSQAQIYASIVSALASIHATQGRFAEAEIWIRGLLAYLESQPALKNSISYASAINTMGGIMEGYNRLEEAEQYYARAAELYKLKTKEGAGPYLTALNNRANILTSLYSRDTKHKGHFQRAEAALKDNLSQRLALLGPKHIASGLSMVNLASLYIYSEDFAQAEAWSLKGLELFETYGGAESEYRLITLNNLASLYRRWQKPALAQQKLNQALAINLRYRDSFELKTLLDLEYRSSELAISTPILLESMLLYYKLYESLEQRDTAYLILRKIVTFSDKIRHSFRTEEDKLRSLGELNSYLNLALDLALELRPDNYLEEVFLYSEMNRARLLSEANQSRQQRRLNPLPPKFQAEELRLKQAWEDLRGQAARLKTAEEKRQHFERYQALEQEVEAFNKEVRQEYPQYFQAGYNQTLHSLSKVQASLQADELFLSYVLSQDKIYLLAIEAKSAEVQVIELGSKALKAHIAKLHQALSDYAFIREKPQEAYQQFSEEAHWAYQTLLKPVLEARPHIKTLRIISDGELGYLPFEVFLSSPAPSAESQYKGLAYLLRDYRISYAYSASLWCEAQRQPHNRGKGRLLGMVASYEVKDSSTWANRPASLRLMRQNLAPLPAAKLEIEALAQEFRGEFRFEQGANEAWFKAEANQYDLIHLVAHGLLNRRNPLNSSLVFTEDGDSLQDNFLEAWEIAQLQLPARLIVLSACETGYGKFAEGEGILSLGRSFAYAGVPALVFSLWQVNDASTALLMPLFYEQLAQGQSLDEALRQAKLQYLDRALSEADAHPAYWAAFVHLGDTRPVDIQKNRSPYLYIGLGLGLLSLAVLLAWFWRKGG